MKILACDTALGACSAAVVESGHVLAHAFVEMVRGHAEALAPMIEQVMRDAGIPFAALERLAVTTGPGTFTGQRVGLAFMRAAALALKVPLIGVTTLDVMAAEGLSRAPAPWSVAIADAKREEVYLGGLSADGATILEPALVAKDAAIAIVTDLANRRGAPALAGTAAEWMAAHVPGAIDSRVRQPDAVFVARLAARRPIPEAPPKPLYLRAPDAKLPLMTAVAAAGPADAAALAALHARSIEPAWDAGAFCKLFAGPGVFAFAAPATDWRAFILARTAVGEAEILTLATLPEARRQGLARALVMTAAAEAEHRGAGEIFLEVAADNIAAIALYTALGFARAGLRPRYYVRGQGAIDAILLRAPLPLK